MECKSVIFYSNCHGHLELIDTLWNVNNITNAIKNAKQNELIDTLWNVNFVSPPSLSAYALTN